MIAAWAWALLWAAAPGAKGIDCSKVEPAPVADKAAARAYLEVGDGERRQGNPETAAVAFREAIRLDPSSAPARARLLDLCRAEEPEGDEVVSRAARAVEEGRYEEAVALLGPRYRAKGQADPSTALLYGISLYERGEDAAAQEALERAQQSEETRDPASVFLGLLALRSGDSERAEAQFARVDRGASSELSATARELSALARRNARLAVSMQAEGGYDSNVDQFPDQAGSGTGDFLYGGMASALFRPLGERGPYAVAGARLRNLQQFGEYDLGWVGGAAGYRLELGQNQLRVEYAYDQIWLDFQPFLGAHQIQLDGRLEVPFGRLGGLVSARAETYSRLEQGVNGIGNGEVKTEQYSGPTFDAEVSVGWAGSPGELRLLYRGELHRSQKEELSWLDHGPGLRAVAAFSSRRVLVDARVTARTHLAAEPGPGNVVRQDTYLDGAISFEQDLVGPLSFSLTAGGRKAFSNVPNFVYTRLYGSAGLIFTAGLW
ncbi:MAG TPA: hypothetical protein VIG99_05435 [Myxococcaceae bacterium]